MNDLRIFNSPEFGEVRTTMNGNEVLFAATDVARILGYANPNDAVLRHCKSDGVVNREGVIKSGTRKDGSFYEQIGIMKFITKGNLIRLVASSTLPAAERIESWIFDEVIPTVLETGGYMIARQDETPEEIMARALNIAQDTLKRREERILMLEHQSTMQQNQLKEDAPKVRYVDAVLQSVNTYTTTQIAKELGLDAQKLNKTLKEKGILFKQSGIWMLTAKYQSKDYTKTRTQTYTRNDGSIGTSMYTVWTEKGREFIHSTISLKKSA